MFLETHLTFRLPEHFASTSVMANLVGRACDATPDQDGRGRILLEWLVAATRSIFGLGGAVSGFGSPEAMAFGPRYQAGSASPEVIRQYTEHMEQDVDQDPVYADSLRRVRPGLMIVRRHDVIDDAAWRAHPHYLKRRKGFGVEECLYGSVSFGTPGTFMLLSLHRPESVGPYSDEESGLVATWLASMEWLVAHHLRSRESDRVLALLRPHERVILAHLQNGLGEKQIAAFTGLTRNTVHTYCKRVYKVFGVGTRAELFHECARLGIRSRPDDPQWVHKAKLLLVPGEDAPEALPGQFIRSAKARAARGGSQGKKR